MRQCKDCTWRFDDAITACPECGSQRSFVIAGTTRTNRPAAPAKPQTASIARSGLVPVPAVGGAAVLPAPPAMAAGGLITPAAPDYDGGWFESGIRVAGLALVCTSAAYLTGIFFLAGGTMSLGRSAVLLAAGAMCFIHSPWGIKTAKTGCYGGAVLDIKLLIGTLANHGFGRFAITELVNLAVLGICLYLLHHDGFPSLKPWFRALAVACGLYLVMLVVCSFGTHRELDEKERQARDEYAQEILGKDAQPARTFLADGEHRLNGFNRAESLRLLSDLERAGARDIRAAQLVEDSAHYLVMRFPEQESRRAALRAAVVKANHADEPDPDAGEQFAVVACFGAHGVDGGDQEIEP